MSRPLRDLLTAAPLLAAILLSSPGELLAAQQDNAPASDYVIRSTVRRVILDVVVTDSEGRPVQGLTRDDFALKEDGAPQHILSFDTHELEPVGDAALPKPPVLPTNTYLSLPSEPERGPLYILLLDLINTEEPDQLTMRPLLTKFIEQKEPGTRFAIFVLSDELRLVQGFTSDRKLLHDVLDTQHPRAHVPMVFLYGRNYGRGNEGLMVDVFNHIGGFVDGLPGRKNLIWLSGRFPMRLFPDREDGPGFADRIKETLSLLARNQVSIYPVDARGVVLTEARNPGGTSSSSGAGAGGTSGGSGSAGAGSGSGGATAGGGTSSGPASPSSGGPPAGAMPSQLAADYDSADQIAKLTGGHAFYSNNDIASELADVVNRGSNYYSLTYSPSNQDYTGELRKIELSLTGKDYHLAYRRNYYAQDRSDSLQVAGTKKPDAAPDAAKTAAARPVDDSLGVEMQFGAPMAHGLLFKAHVQALGPPAMGTPEQMANLADEPAYFHARRRNKPAKPMAPIKLQTFMIEYTLPVSQIGGQRDNESGALNLEVAAAAFNADGRMVNGTVHNAFEGVAAGPTATPQPGPKSAFLRIQQQIDVPVNATSLRVAVRDMSTDRLGTIDVPLPLSPEPAAQAQAPTPSSGAKSN